MRLGKRGPSPRVDDTAVALCAGPEGSEKSPPDPGTKAGFPRVQRRCRGRERPRVSPAHAGSPRPLGLRRAKQEVPRSASRRSSAQDPIPVCTSLLGDTSDTAPTGLAQRLARKTNKQVFVSYNLQNTDSDFALLVENRIKEEMEAFPEKF
ncbi:proteasome assembly chaperone 4 isoform X1 [Heterocephalus glaber]|uniref:Proteasome assembly chaperone 4 isoform X1 n=1 Tax=Heterocephalus glaber TaxID=10181 RepID=A0AAX6QYB5_HETGA|nr:proteasome assembly chaperone 4 isoform X1 [Heterocephalus glaber]